MAVPLEEVNCRECNADELYMDVKKEPEIYKVGAYCHGCQHDYGILQRIPRSETSHLDQVYNIGEESITDILQDT